MNIGFLNLAIVKFYSRIVLRKISRVSLIQYRKVENEYKKLLKLNADIRYLEFCSTNQLLPSFTNFRLYDVTAHHEKETINFKRKLLEREIEKHHVNAAEVKKTLMRSIVNLSSVTSPMKFHAAINLLKRIGSQFESDTLYKHRRKLKSLYGSEVFLPENKSIITNLSNQNLSETELSVLSKGLKFGLKTKIDPIEAKIGVERLFFDISTKELNGSVTVSEKSDLKIKLKHYAIRNNTDSSRQNLTPAESQALKSLRSNNDIIIQKPDKGGGCCGNESYRL